LKARAVDDLGVSAFSSAVSFRITEPFPNANADQSAFLPDGRFKLHVTGAPGQSFRIDSSTDATNWTPALTNTLTSSYYDFLDETTQDLNAKFYRVTPLR
jgi:hypothetical protein